MRNYSQKTRKKINRFRTPSSFIMNEANNKILTSETRRVLIIKKSLKQKFKKKVKNI